MKKEILINNDAYYEAQYIISKKKYTIYYYYKTNNYRKIAFYKNNMEHRLCNLGPQYRDKDYIFYLENNKFHNLYGPALFNKDNIKTHHYYIYDIGYTKDKFQKYISIYNNLSYKRTYL